MSCLYLEHTSLDWLSEAWGTGDTAIQAESGAFVFVFVGGGGIDDSRGAIVFVRDATKKLISTCYSILLECTLILPRNS